MCLFNSIFQSVGKIDNMVGNPMLGPPGQQGPPPGPHGHGHMGPNHRPGQFDPLSSMAAMTDSPQNQGMNPNMQGPGSMNMSSMQISGSNMNSGPGGGPGGAVNFHTSISSMQNLHHQMNTCPNPNGSGPPFGNQGSMVGQQSIRSPGPHNQGAHGHFTGSMVGPNQTVNNTYVNANLSIQQLNIQNMPPNYNPNMPPNSQGMPMGMPNQMGNNMPNQMGNNMAMMAPSISPKIGQNGPMGGQRMSPGPQNGPPGQHMMNGPFQGSMPRGMHPGMNFGPGGNNIPGGGPRGAGPGFNVQVKPNAPNTIQYLPNRASNPSQPTQNKPPNLDFLKQAASLTNLDKKVPTHNLQYFPNSGGGNGPGPPNGPGPNSNNMGQGPPPGHNGPPGNMPMNVGPGRPPGPQYMMRGGPGPGQHMMGPGGPMMPGNDMYNRPPGQGGGPGPPPGHMMGPGGGPNMFNMHHPNGPNGGGFPPGNMSPGMPSMPPDMSQSLPPGGYQHNYKQQQPNFMGGPGPGPGQPGQGGPMNDPNYDRQYLNFQQQLYATSSRGNNQPGNNGSCTSNQVHNNNPMSNGPGNFYGQSK